MKKLFALATILLAAASCSSDGDEAGVNTPPLKELAISLSSDEQFVTIEEAGRKATIEAAAEGLTATLKVTTAEDAAWSVSEAPEWIALNQEADMLELAIAENESTDSREITLTITATNADGTAEATVRVFQNGTVIPDPELTLSSESSIATVDAAGTAATVSASIESAEVLFAVATNVAAWSVSEAPEWIVLTKSDDALTVAIAANGATTSRSAELTLTAENVKGTATAVITVEQEAAPVATLDVDETTVVIPAEGGTVEVGYTSNQTALTATRADAIDAAEVSAPGNEWVAFSIDKETGKIIFTAEANDTGSVREAVVAVTAGEGDNTVTKTIAVSQQPVPAQLVFTVKTTADGKEVPMPTLSSTDADIAIVIDYGDGSAAETFTAGITYSATKHTYATAGEYTVTIASANKITALSFSGNSYLTSVQTNTLDCSGVTTLARCFYNCRALVSVGKIFSKCSAVTTTEYAFYGCIALKTVPEGLFDAMRATCKNFNNCFQNDTALTSIPAGLFENCEQNATFASVFYGAGITELPARCFAGSSKVKELRYICNSCSNLERIAADAFEGCSAVTDFYGSFTECSALTEIPAGLFADCKALATLEYCFQRCSGLTSLPASLFDNNRSLRSLDFAFYHCDNLTGETPYTMIDGNKVHLYERELYPEAFQSPASFEYCFSYDELLDDYATMRALDGKNAEWAQDY